MKERPIIFSGPMVRAILDGRKTQTRRVVKAPPYEPTDDGIDILWATNQIVCPYGKPGDHLWVRETWRNLEYNGGPYIEYSANAIPHSKCSVLLEKQKRTKWKPSIFMPRWASRITLEITGVMVERVREISENDAISEGIPVVDCIPSAINGYRVIWDSINSRRGYPWSSNPWVWVIEFKRVTTMLISCAR